jgi:hypothetical protein
MPVSLSGSRLLVSLLSVLLIFVGRARPQTQDSTSFASSGTHATNDVEAGSAMPTPLPSATPSSSQKAGGSDNGGNKSGANDSGGSDNGGNKSGGGKTSKTATDSKTSGDSSQASSNIFFESQMLAFGAVEEISHAAALQICKKISDAKPKASRTIIVYDPQTFAPLQAYEAFELNLLTFRAMYGSLGPAKQQNEATSPLDVASLVAQFASASTTNTPTGFGIPDSALALSIANKIMEECSSVAKLVYPMIAIPSSVATAGNANLMSEIQFVINLKKAAAKVVSTDTDQAANYKEFNDLFDAFLKDLFIKDPATGVPGIATILQGYKLSLLLKQPADTWILYATNIAAGGTQRDRKNLFTNLVWGDIFRYSGGAIANIALIDGTSLELLTSKTYRFMSPPTSIKKTKGADVRQGSNF